MQSFKRIGFWVIVGVVVIVLGFYWRDHQIEKSAQGKKRSVERMEAKSSAINSMPLKARSFDYEGGKLIVFDIPVPSLIAPEIPEKKRCVLWRDVSGVSSSISCENEPRMVFDE